MPFFGGWIGYHYAPEKIIEIDRIVKVVAETKSNSVEILSDIFSFDDAKIWSISSATSSVYVGNDEYVEDISGLELFTVTYVDENGQIPDSSGFKSFEFTDGLRGHWADKYEMIVNADGLPSRDLDVYKINDSYVSVSMKIKYREPKENEYVEPGSIRDSFGIGEAIEYSIFISEPLQ